MATSHRRPGPSDREDTEFELTDNSQDRIAEPETAEPEGAEEEENVEENELENELEGDEVAGQAETKTEETKEEDKPAKAKKAKRETILTPFRLTKIVNDMLEEEGVLDLATGKPKRIGSPMLYIYANKGAFETHTATDGSGRMECDPESAHAWAEAYVKGAKEKYEAAVKAMQTQMAAAATSAE